MSTGKLVRAGEALKKITVADEALSLIIHRDDREKGVSKRQFRRVEAIANAKAAREDRQQQTGYNSRPFVLCGLPIRRPKAGSFVHIRQNGAYTLRITGDPEFGLPFGQDRLIPIWVATRAVRTNSRRVHFENVVEILDEFGLPCDGPHYRRLREGFDRIFYSTIFFGTDEQTETHVFVKRRSYRFFNEIDLWYARNPSQQSLPNEFENTVQLSEEFWSELQQHKIPVDMYAVRALASSSGCLDFYCWLVWRCFTASSKGSNVPLYGPSSLHQQLGSSAGMTERNFRRQIRTWLSITQQLWPQCPATLSKDGKVLSVRNGHAILGDPRSGVLR